MVQLSLAGFGGGPYLQVVDDYGPVVSGGASAAHYMRAENGQEYIVKGSPFTPDQPYVVVNEYVATKLADMLGLPVLDHRFVEFQSHICFASAWMDSETFYPQVTDELFQRCINRGISYSLVAFDAWVCNEDRHNANLIARRTRPGRSTSGEQLSLLLNDHGHCFMQPTITPASLSGRVTNPVAQYIRLPFLSTALTDAGQLGSAIGRVEQLPSAAIESVVRAVPATMLQSGEQDEFIHALLDRGAQLRNLFNSERAAFPNLGGGPI